MNIPRGFEDRLRGVFRFPVPIRLWHRTPTDSCLTIWWDFTWPDFPLPTSGRWNNEEEGRDELRNRSRTMMSLALIRMGRGRPNRLPIIGMNVDE